MQNDTPVTSTEYILSLFKDGFARERAFREWQDKMPALRFDSSWEVTVVPPFAGAIARFLVDNGTRRLSIYFDAYNALGAEGNPYWELYPGRQGDPDRFLLGEEEEMMQVIRMLLTNPKAGE